MIAAGLAASMSAAGMVAGTISGVHLALADPARDELRVLGPEVNDEDGIAAAARGDLGARTGLSTRICLDARTCLSARICLGACAARDHQCRLPGNQPPAAPQTCGRSGPALAARPGSQSSWPGPVADLRR